MRWPGASPAFPAPNPRHAVPAFRNVLSMQGAAKGDGQGPRSGGPKQVAGGSDTFLAEV